MSKEINMTFIREILKPGGILLVDQTTVKELFESCIFLYETIESRDTEIAKLTETIETIEFDRDVQQQAKEEFKRDRDEARGRIRKVERWFEGNAYEPDWHPTNWRELEQVLKGDLDK